MNDKMSGNHPDTNPADISNDKPLHKSARRHGTPANRHSASAPEPVSSLNRDQIKRIQTVRWDLHEHIDHDVEPKVELVKEYGHGPKRRVGGLEKHISWMVHTAAQIVISYQPYLCANGLEFNAVLASERAAALLFKALEQFTKQNPAYKLEIKVGEKQRYGVPGYINTGVTFGNGKVKLEIAADVIEASRNIYRHYPANRSNLGPIIGMGAAGSFVGFDDMFYINGRVAASWLDKTKVKNDPRLPPAEFVASLSKAANQPMNEIKVLILCRDRNFDADGSGTIQQLIDAGISVETRDQMLMRKRVAANQIYPNGNLYLTNNDFFPRTGLITGKLHGIILTGRPTEGELLLMMNHIRGGQGMAEIVSHDSLTDGVADIVFSRDKKKWSEYEKGRWRSLITAGEISGNLRDRVWTPSLPTDMGVAVGFCKDSYWDTDIKGVKVDAEGAKVSCDVSWMGASGDYKIFRITYPIRLPDRQARRHSLTHGRAKVSNLLEWSESAMHFRQFKTAVHTAKRACQQATGAVELERCKGTLKRAVAFAALVSRKDASRAMQTAITVLSGGSETLYKESPATRRLLRRLLHTQADTYRRTGMAAIDRHFRIIGPGAEKQIKAANDLYQTVLTHFEEDIEGTDAQFNAYLAKLNSRIALFGAQQDRLEYNTARWQLKVVTYIGYIIRYSRGLPVSLNFQSMFAHLAHCYERLAQERKSIVQKSALKYQGRMLEVLDLISRTFGNRLPRDKVLSAARTYMQESMWEPALRTYARMIDPRKAYKIYSPKFDDPFMRRDFYESIYMDLYLFPVLADYLRCRMLLLKKTEAEITALLEKTDQWLADFEAVMAEWCHSGRLISTNDGVVYVKSDLEEKSKVIELLTLISDYQPDVRGESRLDDQ